MEPSGAVSKAAPAFAKVMPAHGPPGPLAPGGGLLFPSDAMVKAAMPSAPSAPPAPAFFGPLGGSLSKLPGGGSFAPMPDMAPPGPPGLPFGIDGVDPPGPPPGLPPGFPPLGMPFMEAMPPPGFPPGMGPPTATSSEHLPEGSSTAAFFGALPNPLNAFSPNLGSTQIKAGETLWSAQNPKSLVWGPLDDVVMGGASESFLKGTTWKGTIVTEGGGFAGIRTQPIKPAFDVRSCAGLKVRVKGGDGQRFKLIIRDSYDWNGIAWSYEFDTQTLLPSMDGIVEASAPFTEFVPTLFARRVPNQQFDKSQLTAIQITLSKFGYDGALNPNFKAGSFELEDASFGPDVVPKAPPGSPPRTEEKPEIKKRKKGVEGLASNKAIKNGGAVTIYSGYDALTVEPKVAETSEKPPASAQTQITGQSVIQGLQRQLPAGWEMRKSRSTGKVYYVNEKLGKSQFEPPACSTVDKQVDKKKKASTKSKDLNSKDSAKRSDAVNKVVSLMTEHHLYPISFAKMDGIKALVKLLGNTSATSVDRANACMALGHVAKHNAKLQEIVGSASLQVVVKLLRSNKATPFERNQASYALAQLANRNQRHQMALLKLGVLPDLVQQLSGSTDGDFGSAAYALATIADGIEKHQTAIRLEGAIGPLVQHLSSSFCPEDRIDAAFCLARLAENHEENQEAIFEEEELVAGLMFLLNSTSLAERINAMMAISRIVEGYEEAQVAFAEAGAITTLIQALPCDAALRRPAIIALGSLATLNAQNQQAIVEAGVLEILVPQLCTGSSAERREAASTISKLDVPDAQFTDRGGMLGLMRANEQKKGRWAKWQKCNEILNEPDPEDEAKGQDDATRWKGKGRGKGRSYEGEMTMMIDRDKLTKSWQPRTVFTLADRFLLPRLARLCEVFLSECTLRSATVIPIKSPRRPTLFNLEAACWDFLEEHWKEVLQHTANLEEIITNQHPLVLELLKASRGVKRTARKPDDETPAA
eukprot:s1329_g8.t2